MGLDGLEPSTSRLSGVRSNHLSYRPLQGSQDLNPRHSVLETDVLPLNYTPMCATTCATTHFQAPSVRRKWLPLYTQSFPKSPLGRLVGSDCVKLKAIRNHPNYELTNVLYRIRPSKATFFSVTPCGRAPKTSKPIA